MRVKYLYNVGEHRKGEIAGISAEQAEKLIRTGYAVEAPEEVKKAKAA